MKTVLYFILSILTIVYVGFMCYINFVPDAVNTTTTFGIFLSILAKFGGVVLVFVFAFVNFVGSPLKVIFFTMLIFVAIAYALSIILPYAMGTVTSFLGGLWTSF